MDVVLCKAPLIVSMVSKQASNEYKGWAQAIFCVLTHVRLVRRSVYIDQENIHAEL